MIELLGVGARRGCLAKLAGVACPPLIEYAPLLERYFGPQAWTPHPGIDRWR